MLGLEVPAFSLPVPRGTGPLDGSPWAGLVPAASVQGPWLLYQRLRQQLLQELLRHRALGGVPGLVGEAHAMHRRTCQRQLGALRQAYRRTQEAAAWGAYGQARGVPHQP